MDPSVLSCPWVVQAWQPEHVGSVMGDDGRGPSLRATLSWTATVSRQTVRHRRICRVMEISGQSGGV